LSALGTIDVPLNGQRVAREGFLIEGFGFDEASGPFKRISVRYDGTEIAYTTTHFVRPDVIAHAPQLNDAACGYRVFVALPSTAPERTEVTVVGEFASGQSWSLTVAVIVGANDYRSGPYGTLADPNVDVVYHRNDIYGVGPPSPVPSIDCVQLLTALLRPGDDVVDVGCGVGAYARPLLDSGIAWQGCEINPEFIADMRARDLPVTQVTGNELPFAADQFGTAMCIEVLEHILEYEPFLAEIARVSRGRAIFSVPNAEAIPVLADRLLVPWHLLEADHKNFFTRWSLASTLGRHWSRVDVLPYGVMPVASSNGTPVYYHLLAVAQNESEP
jgi:2-polyprenyl-3-methyl-5-hydroxy-6-metoxy-1,4-benzoquinol methylase